MTADMHSNGVVASVACAGKQLMAIWDNLCQLLRARQISVEDVSNKVSSKVIQGICCCLT